MKQWDVNILQNGITQWQPYRRVRRDRVIHSDKRPLGRLFGSLTRLPVLVSSSVVFSLQMSCSDRGQRRGWRLEAIVQLDYRFVFVKLRPAGLDVIPHTLVYLDASLLTCSYLISGIEISIHPSITNSDGYHCWWHWVSLGCCRLSELSGESGVHP